MADDNKTPDTKADAQAPADAEKVENAPVTQTPKTDADKQPELASEGSTPTPTTADTEAAANQSAASGEPSKPRTPDTARGGNDRNAGGNRGGPGGNRGGPGGNRGGGGGRGGRSNNRRGGRDEPDDGIVEKLVHINRVSKTVKGGKRFGFAALVIVGDGSGRVGFGHGKAREVPEAITKATAAARKKMIRVALKDGRTLHHDGNGRFGAGKVTIRTAPAGTGIIAGGPMRAVFESLGVADVVTKSVGTSNPYNMIRATFDALTNQTSPKSVAQRRGKKVADLLGRGGVDEAEAQADAAAVAE
ncbi:MAG: 30S ribosomal protein S5 [Pontixanthobacter sp.]